MFRSFFKFLFYLFLLFCFGVTGYFNIRLIPQGYICSFLDTKTGGKIVSHGYLTFLLTGFMQNRWQQTCLSKEKQSVRRRVVFDLPYANFFDVKDNFQITATVDVYFQIDLNQSLFVFDKFSGDLERIKLYLQEKERLIGKTFLDESFKEISRYRDVITSFQVYMRGSSDEKVEQGTFLEDLKKETYSAGILVLYVDVISIQLPDEKVYEEAISDVSSVIKRSFQRNKDVQKEQLEERNAEFKEELEIKHLEKIAKLIEKYPYMIEYFKYDFLSKVPSLSFSESVKDHNLLNESINDKK